jgi:nicotinamidase-related amidase
MTDIAPVDPQRAALLVMDYQPGILDRVDDPDALVARAAQAIATMRRHGGTVGYVRVAFEEADLAAFPPTSGMSARVGSYDALRADSPLSAVDERIAPQEDDIVVRKVRVGAFSTTDLDAQLRARGVDTLVLAGVSTSGVVLSTTRDAYDRDYRLLVLADACADPDAEVHDVLIRQVLARQADVVEVARLDDLLAAP